MKIDLSRQSIISRISDAELLALKDIVTANGGSYMFMKEDPTNYFIYVLSDNGSIYPMTGDITYKVFSGDYFDGVLNIACDTEVNGTYYIEGGDSLNIGTQLYVDSSGTQVTDNGHVIMNDVKYDITGGIITQFTAINQTYIDTTFGEIDISNVAVTSGWTVNNNPEIEYTMTPAAVPDDCVIDNISDYGNLSVVIAPSGSTSFTQSQVDEVVTIVVTDDDLMGETLVMVHDNDLVYNSYFDLTVTYPTLETQLIPYFKDSISDNHIITYFETEDELCTGNYSGTSTTYTIGEFDPANVATIDGKRISSTNSVSSDDLVNELSIVENARNEFFIKIMDKTDGPNAGNISVLTVDILDGRCVNVGEYSGLECTPLSVEMNCSGSVMGPDAAQLNIPLTTANNWVATKSTAAWLVEDTVSGLGDGNIIYDLTQFTGNPGDVRSADITVTSVDDVDLSLVYTITQVIF